MREAGRRNRWLPPDYRTRTHAEPAQTERGAPPEQPPFVSAPPPWMYGGAPHPPAPPPPPRRTTLEFLTAVATIISGVALTAMAAGQWDPIARNIGRLSIAFGQGMIATSAAPAAPTPATSRTDASPEPLDVMPSAIDEPAAAPVPLRSRRSSDNRAATDRTTRSSDATLDLRRDAGSLLRPYLVRVPPSWTQAETNAHVTRWAKGCGVPLREISKVNGGYLIPSATCASGTFSDLLAVEK